MSRQKSLLVGLLMILAWQSLFFVFPKLVDDKYSVAASTGLPVEFADFFYFYYYTGHFPLATESKITNFSEEGAQDIIHNQPETLVMERAHVYRSGDLAKLFLFLPKAWLTGSAENPSVTWFTGIFFCLSLLLLFYAFWRHNLTILGGFIVWCLGSNSMHVYEAYNNHNIFIVPIAIGITLMAANLSLLKNLRLPLGKSIILAVGCGLFLGFFKHVRTEAVLPLVSLIILYMLNKELRWYKRLVVLAALLISFITPIKYLEKFFEFKYQESHALVTKVGGHPYNGDRLKYHVFWHAIYCGLGDFDWKYGYKWADQSAHEYAEKILKDKYNITVPKMIDCCKSDEYFDEAKKYYKRPYEIPEYGQVMKDKVLGDIKNDPLWYLGVHLARTVKILIQSTAIYPLLGIIPLGIPIPTLLALIFAFILWRRREYFWMRLILFPLPLVIVSQAVYSGRGTTFYVFSNMVALGIYLYTVNEKKSFVERYRNWMEKRRKVES